MTEGEFQRPARLAARVVIGLAIGYGLVRFATLGLVESRNYALVSAWWMVALLCKGSRLDPMATGWLIAAALAVAALDFALASDGFSFSHAAIRVGFEAVAVLGAALFGIFLGWLDMRVRTHRAKA
jgi:hypothetical protein